jgi:hypothetical protein
MIFGDPMLLGALSTIRDVIIVFWAALSVVALIFFILAVWSIYRGVKGMIGTVNSTVNQDVKPILSLSQDSVNNVNGTVRFAGDTVARPIIKGLSFIAGARRTISIFTGIAGRGRSD